MSEAKHFLLLTAGPVGSVPAPTGSGAAIGSWTIADILLRHGHAVTVCHIPPVSGYHPDAQEQEELRRRLARLESLGVPVDFTSPMVPEGNGRRPRWKSSIGLVRAALRPCVPDYYPFVCAKSVVRNVLAYRKPDAIYHQHTNTLVTTDGYPVPPRLVMTGDLDDLVHYYRWRMTPVRSFSKYVVRTLKWMAMRKLDAHLIAMLSSCQSVLSGASHVLPKFEKQGIRCRYIPMPWATNQVEPLCLRKNCRPVDAKARILLLGHLAGTPTMAGLYFLVRKTLPHLERLLDPDRFEIHIVGRDAPPADLVKDLARPHIRLCGYVDDLVKEYLESDLMLVPTPIVMGARTRIAEAFSLGCCVVAHAANAAGMPEMIHGENVLLADTGKKLAEAVVQAVNNPQLRRNLGENGRKTWETYYAPGKAIAKIAEELERIADVPSFS